MPHYFEGEGEGNSEGEGEDATEGESKGAAIDWGCTKILIQLINPNKSLLDK